MQVRICSLLIFLAAMPAFCQVEPSAEGGATLPGDEMQMMTPSLVSGVAYPSVAGEDMESNYLTAGVSMTAGYTDNLLPAETSTPVSDFNYMINPSLAYDRSTPRQHTTFAYNPGFTFYEPDSFLDSTDQNANFKFDERLSPRLAFNATDTFMRTSDVFDQSFPFSGGIGGTPQSPVPAVLAPFVQQMSNNGSAAITYQFGTDSMVGAGGSYLLYDYSSPNQNQGLYNSTGGSASAFYDRRFGRNQYVGLDYMWAMTVATPPNVRVTSQMQTLLPFYTLFVHNSFSVTVAAGVQNINVTATQQPTSDSWFPTIVASMGWQSRRTSFAVSYLRVITTGEGLVGGYKSSNVNGSGTWKFARDWHGGVSGGYNTIEPQGSLAGTDYQGGDSITVGATLKRAFGDRITAEVGYDRIHESFVGIPIIAESPDSDRAYVTVTYQFKKPLGR